MVPFRKVMRPNKKNAKKLLIFIQMSERSRAPKWNDGGWSPSRTKIHQEIINRKVPSYTKLLVSDAPLHLCAIAKPWTPEWLHYLAHTNLRSIWYWVK